jgi:sarcosine oxidase subunit beta
MTPDGIIILGKIHELSGHYLAVGMCGQGFMLGPGVGLNMAKLIVHGKPDIDPEVFSTIGFYRDYHAKRAEALK